MINYILFIPLIASFFITLFFLPSWINRARTAGLTGKDMNKYHGKEVAEAGGVTVIAGFIFGLLLFIAIKTFNFQTNDKVVEIFALLSCILIVAFIGLIDGVLGWKKGLGRKIRVFLVFFAAIPLMVINAGEPKISLLSFNTLNLGIIYPLIFIPLGIIGASTTFNFLAGFNGLEARQGILILSALAVVAYLTDKGWLAVILACMVSALCAFLIFNSYPARVFPGDVLTYAIGALIAAAAIVGNFEKFAVFIFMPYIAEVLLKLRGKLKKESFGLPNKDGSIDLKDEKVYGLEHIAIKILKKQKSKVYEKDVVLFINIIQILFIIIGFLIFRKYIFL
jgi:UDP-N-acetylglucosamine--dolichyl-phosphate N-acetylglucosaminephosphotransferase